MAQLLEIPCITERFSNYLLLIITTQVILTFSGGLILLFSTFLYYDFSS